MPRFDDDDEIYRIDSAIEAEMDERNAASEQAELMDEIGSERESADNVREEERVKAFKKRLDDWEMTARKRESRSFILCLSYVSSRNGRWRALPLSRY